LILDTSVDFTFKEGGQGVFTAGTIVSGPLTAILAVRQARIEQVLR